VIISSFIITFQEVSKSVVSNDIVHPLVEVVNFTGLLVLKKNFFAKNLRNQDLYVISGFKIFVTCQAHISPIIKFNFGITISDLSKTVESDLIHIFLKILSVIFDNVRVDEDETVISIDVIILAINIEPTAGAITKVIVFPTRR